MKEKPIIFNTENVKAILEGRKSQTRRVIKPQPIYQQGQPYSQWVWNKKSIAIPEGIREGVDYALWWDRVKNPESIIRFCPYGQVDDRLWARETFCDYCTEDIEPKSVCYKALPEQQPAMDFCQAIHWRPSIFMPRWASRITLGISEIRVERVQEITEEDALAEGVEPLQMESWRNPEKIVTQSKATEEYQRLWDSLIPKYPWESNPWVWVVSFKRVT